MKKIILSALIFAPFFLIGQVINIPADYPTIQEGINAAVNGDTVLVQPGTYYENLFVDNKSIRLVSTFIINNDPQAIAQTIIDANDTGTVIFINAVGPGMEIAGFTLQNGNSTDGPGGGLEIHGSSVFIRNMVISNNFGLEGGGVFCEGSSLLLLDCNITDNSAQGHGGGIKTFNSHLFLDRCQVTFNSSEMGAGLRCDYNMPYFEVFNVTLDSCLFADNTASGQTAGVFIRRDGQYTELNVTIRRSAFLNNTANNSGALQVRGDSIYFKIQGCRFMYNEVTSYTAGAAFLLGCSGEVENCVFGQNSAGLGGGNWNAGGMTCWAIDEVFINNCTFFENHAPYGAGLTVGPGATAYATNCIFWGNANQQIAVIANNDAFGTLMIDYTDIQYGQDSIRLDTLAVLNWGENNIDEDPLLVGSGDDPCSLSMDSPCIDAGPEDITGWDILPYDILGNVRVWDGDENGSLIIDMGAYEFGAPIYIGIPEHPGKHLNGVVISNLYPNPAKDIIYIEYQMPENEQLHGHLYSISGCLIDTFIENAGAKGTLQYDVTELPPGIYIYKLDVGNSFALRKFIVP